MSTRDDAHPSLRLGLGVALALALLPLLGLMRIRLAEQRLTGRSTTAQSYYLPAPGVLRALTFGYNELAADLLWVRTIAYFADHVAGDRDMRHLARYLDTTRALDGHFYAVYRYGGAMLTAGSQDNAMVLRAIRLLEAGHRSFPKDHKIAMRIGTLYMMDLRTRSPQERRKWRMRGANWLHRAVLLGASQPWLPSLAAQMYTREGQRQLAIMRLRELYAVIQAPETRRQIANKLRELQAAGMGERLHKQAERFQAAQARAGLPFVSADLYGLLRLPAPIPFTLGTPKEASVEDPAGR